MMWLKEVSHGAHIRFFQLDILRSAVALHITEAMIPMAPQRPKRSASLLGPVRFNDQVGPVRLQRLTHSRQRQRRCAFDVQLDQPGWRTLVAINQVVQWHYLNHFDAWRKPVLLPSRRSGAVID